MPMPDGTPCCAGSVVVDQLVVMREMVGEDVYEAALARMPEHDREIIGTLLPVSWIDPDIINRFVVEIAQEAGREVGPFMFDVANIGVERTLTTVWRMLLRFTSDNALVTRTPILYKKTYDAGTMTSHIERRGEAHIQLDGWPTIARLDLIGLQGGIEATLRCAGRKKAKVRFQRTATGAMFTATWDT